MKNLSRRHFLKVSAAAGGGMMVGVTYPAVGSELPSPDYSELTAWIRIAANGTVTIAPPHMEIGQAVATSQTQLIADELDADWASLVIRTPEAAPQYGHMFAGGSQTIALTWNPLRQAGATARAMLIEAAARQWKVPAADCSTEPGFVVHAASQRKLSYGALATAAARLPQPKDVPLKAREDWRYIGKPIGKHEAAQVVVGKQIYGMDFRVPGMLVATLERFPTRGAKARYDPAAALKIPGVLQVVEVPAQGAGINNPGGNAYDMTRGGIAVVARNTWAAFKGRAALAIEWDEPHAGESSDSLTRSFTEAMAAGGEEFHRAGDPEKAFKAPHPIQVDVEYSLPFLSHMMMEPSNAVVQIRNGKVECWGPTQNPNQDLPMVAKVLNIPNSDVSFQAMPSGGGFGRRAINAAVEAALITSQIGGVPVQLVWQREDETRFDHYRTGSRTQVKIAADQDGNVLAWNHHLASLEHQSSTATDATALGPDFLYEVPNVSFRHSTIPSLIEVGAMRGVNSVYNVFAVESAVDELAHALGQDPFALRMKWFKQKQAFEKIVPPPTGTEGVIEPTKINFARMIGVLNACREKIGWNHRPAPGKGMGLATYNHLGTHCAVATEVNLNEKGKLKVVRLVAAIDMGIVVNPLGARAQVEGGLLFGLSNVMRERITFRGSKAEQSSFTDYPVLTMADTPQVDVVLVDSGASPTGAGEVAVPGVGPSVISAIFAATGVRIRELPVFHARPDFDPNI